MLSFQDFFTDCTGLWQSDRTYHFILKNESERSYTEFRVSALEFAKKQQILAVAAVGTLSGMTLNLTDDATRHRCPGFAIAFDTESETGEKVSMSLQALFVPDAYVTRPDNLAPAPRLPIAAQVETLPQSDLVQGFYLRDEGYSETGAIAGRFTYQPTRQTLEMTTFYSRSVAVDQMRLVAPNLRIRTIVTYQRPAADQVPTVINLMGFGVERKQLEAI